MLETLTLRNYRKHKQLTVELDPHITTITGDSFRGKSAILRGLRWAALNKPAGTSFIRWGAKQTTIQINVDGHKVKRIRSKGRNRYKLDDRIYAAFGNNVPDKVAKLLAIAEINFQSQMDPSYLFHLSPGEVAKKLNSIVDLAVIDKALAFLIKEQKRLNILAVAARERMESTRTNLRGLRHVPKMVRDWRVIRQAKKMIHRDNQKLHHLQALNENLQAATKQVKQIERTAKQSKKDFKQCTAALNRYKKSLVELDTLNDDLQRLDSIVREVRTTKTNWQHALQAKEKYLKRRGRRCPICARKLPKQKKR